MAEGGEMIVGIIIGFMLGFLAALFSAGKIIEVFYNEDVTLQSAIRRLKKRAEADRAK
jgi:hypothetical protein